MGNVAGRKSSPFAREELLMYRDLTFFTEAEVLHAFQRFLALAPDFVTKRAIFNDKDVIRLPMDSIQPLEVSMHH